MKKVKKKLCMALSVAACLCVGVAMKENYEPKAAETVVVAAEEEYSATDVKLIDGASIRLDSELNGIRFGVYIGDEAPAPYSATKKLGVLIIPEACLAADDKLEYGEETSKGYHAKAVEFDGEEERLAEGAGEYANGKLFNAVLNLTGKGENYINNKYVARAYVRDTETGGVSYLGEQISRAPAFVAAEALDVNTADPEKVLADYLQYVTLTANDVNMKKGGEIPKAASTNVEDIKIAYSEVVEGKVIASVAGGTLVKEFSVAVFDDQHTFKNEYYTPDGAFKFDAYEVNEVKLGGTALVEGVDYTVANNLLSVNKSLVAEADETLTVVSSAGNVTVDLRAYEADFSGLSSVELQEETLGSLENATFLESTGTAVYIKAIEAGKEVVLNYHPDYIKAMFAQPYMTTMQTGICVEDLVDYGANSVYCNTTTASGGLTNCGATVNDGTSIIDLDFTRSTYNATLALEATNPDAMENNFRIRIPAAKVGADTKIKCERILGVRADGEDYATNGDRVNHVYADAQAITENGGLSYVKSSSKPLASLKVQGVDKLADGLQKQTGNTVNIQPALINAEVRTNVPLILSTRFFEGNGTTLSAWAEEIFGVTTKLFLDESQYINKDEVVMEGDFVLNLGDLTGQRVKRVKLNGAALDVSAFDNGKVTVDKAILKDGHNVVEVIVERDIAQDNVLYTAVDTYLRSICVYGNWELWSAMTFEGTYESLETSHNGRMNPFLSILGANARTVSSTNLDADYCSVGANQRVAVSADGVSVTESTVYNQAVMELEIPANYKAQLYVPTAYVVARRVKAVETYAKLTTAPKRYSEQCYRMYALAGDGSGVAQWSFFVEGDAATDYRSAETSVMEQSSTVAYSTYKANAKNVQICKPMFAKSNDPFGVIYDAANKTILKNYVYMQFNVNTAARTLYLDELFSASSSPYGVSAHQPLSVIYQKAE